MEITATEIGAIPAGPPTAAQSAAAELGLDVSIDYLKVGDAVYAVKKVGEGIDIHAEVKEFYEKKYVDAKTRLTTALVSGAEADQDAQLRKLSVLRGRHTISIPPALQEMDCRWVPAAGEVLKVLPVVYHPHLVLGTKEAFQGKGLNVGTTSKFAPFPGGKTLQAWIKSDIYIPITVAICPRLKKIYMFGARGFHTFGDTSVCYNNSNFEAWAALDIMQLSQQLSIINLFSLAYQALDFMGETIAFNEIVTNETIVKVEEEVRWTV